MFRVRDLVNTTTTTTPPQNGFHHGNHAADDCALSTDQTRICQNSARFIRHVSRHQPPGKLRTHRLRGSGVDPERPAGDVGRTHGPLLTCAHHQLRSGVFFGGLATPAGSSLASAPPRAPRAARGSLRRPARARPGRTARTPSGWLPDGRGQSGTCG